MRKELLKKYPDQVEKSREYARKYYEDHKEEILAKRRGNQEFLAKKRVYFDKWKKENKDKFDQTVYDWKSTGSGIYSCLYRNAKQRNIPVNMTRQEFIDWYELQEKRCCYCYLTIEEISKLPDWYVRRSGAKRLSVDRKDNNRGYELDNIVLSCYMCNTMKNSFLSFDEMSIIGGLVLMPKLTKLLEGKDDNCVS